LFGRNSTGGAISFTTAGPTGKYGAIFEGTIGNYNRLRGRITINTPEWNGLSARVTYVHDENEGSVKNSAPTRRSFIYPGPFGTNKASKTFGANNTESMMASVRYAGIDRLMLDYKFDYTDLETTPDGMQLLVPGSLATFLAGQPALGGTNVSGLKRLNELPLDGLAPATQKTWGHSLTGVYELSDQVSLKYIGAVRGFKVNTQSELDGNFTFDPVSGEPFQRLAAIRYAKQRQWSHELQLLGKTGRVDWVAGAFYFREKAYLNSPVAFGQSEPDGALIPVTNPGSYLAGGKLQHILNKSLAAYAHANFHITDELELGGGIRYSSDKRMEDDLLADGRVPPRGKHRASQDRIDYDASIKYQFAQNSNIYAKFVTGFVSGGVFNSVEFLPETAKSYEAGLKSEWFDRRLRLNVAVFQSDLKNLQTSSFLVGPGTVLINTGSQRARGVEVETTIVPVDGLTLTGNYGFTDVNSSRGIRTDQPRHSAYLAMQYELPAIGEMQPSFRIDGQFIGRHSRLRCPYGSTTTVQGCTNLQAVDPVLDRALSLDPSWQIGARFTLADIPLGEAKGSVSLWGKNLNNNRQFEYLFSIGSPVLGTFRQPRTYGVDFRMEL
jgi:iron complex outermembrane receptor protein